MTSQYQKPLLVERIRIDFSIIKSYSAFDYQNFILVPKFLEVTYLFLQPSEINSHMTLIGIRNAT